MSQGFLSTLLLIMRMSYVAAIACVALHFDHRSISHSIKRTKRTVFALMSIVVTSAVLYEYVVSGAGAVLMVVIGAALLTLIHHEEAGGRGDGEGRVHLCAAVTCLMAIQIWMIVETRDPWVCIASACALGWCALATENMFVAEATFLLLFALAYFRRHEQLMAHLSHVLDPQHKEAASL